MYSAVIFCFFRRGIEVSGCIHLIFHALDMVDPKNESFQLIKSALDPQILHQDQQVKYNIIKYSNCMFSFIKIELM